MRDTCQMMSVNMATESGARQRDFQNVFYATDVKERNNLLGKDLLISKLNEEDDFRPGILLDIRYDMLANILYTKDSMARSDSALEVQG